MKSNKSTINTGLFGAILGVFASMFYLQAVQAVAFINFDNNQINITDSSALVTFTTDSDCKGGVDLYQNGTKLRSFNANSSLASKSHEVVLTDLDLNQDYNYKLTCLVASETEATEYPLGNTYLNFSTGANSNQELILSNIELTSTNSQIKAMFNSSKICTPTISVFLESTNEFIKAFEDTPGIDHALFIPNLNNNTEYIVELRCVVGEERVDEKNLKISTKSDFDIAFSSVYVNNIKTDSALLNIKTTQFCKPDIYYRVYNSGEFIKISRETAKTEHKIELPNLNHSSRYQLYIICLSDSANSKAYRYPTNTANYVEFSTVLEKSTVDLMQVDATVLSADQVRITFGAKQACSAELFYWTKTNKADLTIAYSNIIKNNHDILLKGLKEATTYQYQIICFTDERAEIGIYPSESTAAKFTTAGQSSLTDQIIFPDDLSTKSGILNSANNKIIQRELSRLQSIDFELSKQVRGRILLQVEERGEAWYVHPDSLKRSYLANGQEAFNLMRLIGLGISNADLSQIPVGYLEDVYEIQNDSDRDTIRDDVEVALGSNISDTDSDNDGFDDLTEFKNGYPLNSNGDYNRNEKLINSVKGKILLQVEGRGEAWYIHPETGLRYFLGRPDDAYEIMRRLSLGISNENISKIDLE